MKANSIEYRQLKEMNERLIRFKESEWEKGGHGDPRGMLMMTIVFSIPFIGWVLLFIGLMAEWYSKWLRMCLVALRICYFYSTKIFRK